MRPLFVHKGKMKCWQCLLLFLIHQCVWQTGSYRCVILYLILRFVSLHIRFRFGGCANEMSKEKPTDFTATTRLLSLICLIFIMLYSTDVIRPMPVSPYINRIFSNEKLISSICVSLWMRVYGCVCVRLCLFHSSQG